MDEEVGWKGNWYLVDKLGVQYLPWYLVGENMGNEQKHSSWDPMFFVKKAEEKKRQRVMLELAVGEAKKPVSDFLEDVLEFVDDPNNAMAKLPKKLRLSGLLEVAAKLASIKDGVVEVPVQNGLGLLNFMGEGEGGSVMWLNNEGSVLLRWMRKVEGEPMARVGSVVVEDYGKDGYRRVIFDNGEMKELEARNFVYAQTESGEWVWQGWGGIGWKK